jgi:hypothetical protein
MIKFYFFLFLILLMQNHSNSYAEDESMTGEEIIKKISDFELITKVEDSIRNNKAVLDPSKKYIINKSFNLCPYNVTHEGTINDFDQYCNKKTKICKCQIQKGKDAEEIAVQKTKMKFGKLIKYYEWIEVKKSKMKFGKLIKYYEDDRIGCFNRHPNNDQCFLFQDEDGKFAYIIPSKYNLKSTKDSADLQKESFITTMVMESFFEVYFSDHEGICKNAKEKFDKKTKETYLDCTVEQRKRK